LPITHLSQTLGMHNTERLMQSTKLWQLAQMQMVESNYVFYAHFSTKDYSTSMEV